ncbi:hypothetical protein MRX96_001787 [Rhipicephalus microplus]
MRRTKKVSHVLPAEGAEHREARLVCENGNDEQIVNYAARKRDNKERRKDTGHALGDFRGEPFVKQCATFKKQLTCSKTFAADCLEGVAKAVATLALETYKESVDEICTTDSKLNEAYHKSIGCLNSVGAKLHSCVNNLQGNLQKAVLKAPKKDLIPHLCCSYGGLLDCAEPALTPCDKVGGKEFMTSLRFPTCRRWARMTARSKVFVELIIEAVNKGI